MSDTSSLIIENSMVVENWIPTREIKEHYPQFSEQQIKGMVWRRAENGFEYCYRIVGKRGYINVKNFGLWLLGVKFQA